MTTAVVSNVIAMKMITKGRVVDNVSLNFYIYLKKDA